MYLYMTSFLIRYLKSCVVNSHIEEYFFRLLLSAKKLMVQKNNFDNNEVFDVFCAYLNTCCYLYYQLASLCTNKWNWILRSPDVYSYCLVSEPRYWEWGSWRDCRRFDSLRPWGWWALPPLGPNQNSSHPRATFLCHCE